MIEIIGGIASVVAIIVFIWQVYEAKRKPMKVVINSYSGLGEYFIEKNNFKDLKPKYYFDNISKYLKEKNTFSLSPKKNAGLYFGHLVLFIELQNNSSEQINYSPFVVINTLHFQKLNNVDFFTIDYSEIGGPADYEHLSGFVGSSNIKTALATYCEPFEPEAGEDVSLGLNITNNGYIKLRAKEKIILRIEINNEIGTLLKINPYIIFNTGGEDSRLYFGEFNLAYPRKFENVTIENEENFKETGEIINNYENEISYNSKLKEHNELAKKEIKIYKKLRNESHFLKNDLLK